MAVTVLGLIVVAGAAQFWMLYVFALIFGIADAFFFPAQQRDRAGPRARASSLARPMRSSRAPAQLTSFSVRRLPA